MKRSRINLAIRQATAFFHRDGWALPPDPRWDVTDFGLGDFDATGLVLINLAEEPEYCEKLMFALEGQKTPAHTHRIKKEDIICRSGQLAIQLWHGLPGETNQAPLTLQRNGSTFEVQHGDQFVLQAGERITLTPGIYHAFYPVGAPAIIGEVSTANDDLHDNIFADHREGRFTGIEEDEPPMVKLIHEL